MSGMLRALILRNDDGRLLDMRDVVNAALAEGKKVMRTEERIVVVEIAPGHSFRGFIAVLQVEDGRLKNPSRGGG